MIERYRGRVSGPLLDRIDLHVEVPAVPYADISVERMGEDSPAIRRRVIEARERQAARGGPGCKARMTLALMRRHCVLDATGRSLMERAVSKLGLSARAHDRVLKVARTIADLAGADQITTNHLGEAIQYRGLDRSPRA